MRLIPFIRIINSVRVLIRHRIIQKSGKRDRDEIYPVFSLYKKSTGMKIKYFTDTDTALVEFSDNNEAQTKEINENI